MFTYEDLTKANAEIKTTDIKGKDYAEVPQRVKAFRSICPNGSIETELLSVENGVCIFRATVKDGETVLATGTAYEREDSTFINKTSYIENCETSAVGRALGFAGFGIAASIASAEEVKNAMLNQEKPNAKPKSVKKGVKMITCYQVDTIKELYTPEVIEKALNKKGVSKLEDLTYEAAEQMINYKKEGK